MSVKADRSPRWDELLLRGRDAETKAVVALLVRRGLVPRLRPRVLKAGDIYKALSGLPWVHPMVMRKKAVKAGSTELTRTFEANGVVVVASGMVIAALVAAAQTTKRPLVGLTALAARYLVEGRATVRPGGAP